jgi:tetratricopeptide (TPR) repeat protein
MAYNRTPDHRTPLSDHTAPRRPRATVPSDVVSALIAAGGPKRGPHLAELLGEAHDHYRHERYKDARRILRRLVEDAPNVAAAHELFGLTLYRAGSWRQAAHELEAYRAMTGNYDQHPVLADCYRALGRHKRVAELWDELRQASPRADLVGEGRIVAAGSLADQGDISGAIKILERGRHSVHHPRDHHLRQWYALASLYERAGDIPIARDLFRRVASHDPDAYDVRDRLKALG